MESDLWRGFVTVANEGSFTAAAEVLPISQSGLSQQIRRLESLLQVTLLEREPRGATLTDAGERLLPLVLELLAAEDAVLAAAHDESDRENVEVMSLFVAEDATGDLLINLIDQLRSSQPDLRVQVKQLSIESQASALISAAPCAAMIERTPTPQPLGSGRRTSLRPEPLAVIVPTDVATPASLTVDEAASLQLRSMSWLPESWLEWFPLLRGTGVGHDDDSVLMVTSFRSAVQSVPLDRQACVAPISIADTVGGGGTRIVPISDAPLASLDLVTTSEHPLLDLLHAVAATIGASATSDDSTTTRTCEPHVSNRVRRPASSH